MVIKSIDTASKLPDFKDLIMNMLQMPVLYDVILKMLEKATSFTKTFSEAFLSGAFHPELVANLLSTSAGLGIVLKLVQYDTKCLDKLVYLADTLVTINGETIDFLTLLLGNLELFNKVAKKWKAQKKKFYNSSDAVPNRQLVKVNCSLLIPEASLHQIHPSDPQKQTTFFKLLSHKSTTTILVNAFENNLALADFVNNQMLFTCYNLDGFPSLSAFELMLTTNRQTQNVLSIICRRNPAAFKFADTSLAVLSKSLQVGNYSGRSGFECIS